MTGYASLREKAMRSTPARLPARASSIMYGIWPRRWMIPAAAFLGIFFALPLLDNLARSFTAVDGSYTLSSYAKLLSDWYYIEVLLNTLAFSFAVTIVSLLIGYPVAYFMVRYSGRLYGFLTFLLVAPLLTSIIMRTFGWRVLFARMGVVNATLIEAGFITQPIEFLNGPIIAVVATVHVLVPFMVLSIATSLQGVDRRLEESAQILGAGRLSKFARVTLPLTLDGVGTGFLLVFMLANGSFVTLLLLGGGSIQTLPLLIYQQFNMTRDFQLGAAMSTLLLVTALACLLVQLRLLKRRGASQR